MTKRPAPAKAKGAKSAKCIYVLVWNSVNGAHPSLDAPIFEHRYAADRCAARWNSRVSTEGMHYTVEKYVRAERGPRKVKP